MHSYTFLRLFIDRPQTKIVTWVYDTEIHNAPKCLSTSEMYFGMWTVNNKSEKRVILHRNFLEMSYELNIKMKFLALLLLGDVKNFLYVIYLYKH